MLVRTPWGRWLDCNGGGIQPRNTTGNTIDRTIYAYRVMLTAKDNDKGIQYDKVDYKTEAEAQEVLDKFFEELLKEDK